MRDINWLIAEKNIVEPEKLNKLRCPNYGLTSLAGIEKFTNLEYLNCSSNKLKSLKGIESLSNLKNLIANDNLITTLSNLSGMGIVYLEVADNKLTSLDGVLGLEKLEKLVISGNGFEEKITDFLDSYKGVDNLKQFLKENPIYASSKVGKLMKTGIFENLISFEDFTK